MRVPTFTFIIFKILMKFITNEGINIVIQDFFNAFGTITITIIVLYYLFITKFYEIYIEIYNMKNSKKNLTNSKKNNIIKIIIKSSNY